MIQVGLFTLSRRHYLLVLYKGLLNGKTVNVSVTQEALRAYAKRIYRTMRKLKRYSTVAVDITKALLNLNSIDVVSRMVIWNIVQFF